MFVVLYSSEQDAWHIETIHEFENKPRNGYKLKASFNTYQECSDYIKNNKIWM